MAVTFANVTDVRIPNGDVSKITETSTGRVLWEKPPKVAYLRMGGIPNSMATVGSSCWLVANLYLSDWTRVDATGLISWSATGGATVTSDGYLRAVRAGAASVTATYTKDTSIKDGVSWTITSS